MTNINTIIEEEKKNARENLMDIDEYQAESLDSIVTSAMQRAYEAGIQKSIEIVEPYWDEAPVQNVVDQLKKEITSNSKEG